MQSQTLEERARELVAECEKWLKERAEEAARFPVSKRKRKQELRPNHIPYEPLGLRERMFDLRYEIALLRLGGTPEEPWEPRWWIGFHSAGMKIRDWAKRKIRCLLEW